MKEQTMRLLLFSFAAPRENPAARTALRLKKYWKTVAFATKTKPRARKRLLRLQNFLRHDKNFPDARKNFTLHEKNLCRAKKKLAKIFLPWYHIFC